MKHQCYHAGLDLEHDFFMIETFDWINVVAVTEEGKFVMVKQHRLGTGEITVETAGGLIEKGEDPADTALRELAEETGYKPGKMFLLKKLASNPAIMNNHIYFYLALGCTKVQDQDLDGVEDIEIALYSRGEIMEMLSSGVIDHSYVVTAFSLYFLSEHNGEKATF